MPNPVRPLRRSSVGALLALLIAGALAGAPAALAAAKAPAPVFRLPFGNDVKIAVTQGWNSGYTHVGRAAYAYDFGLAEGTLVLASSRGLVSFVHAGETACGGPEMLSHANFVTIDHPDGSATLYGHLSAVGVKVGDKVVGGQPIGRAGSTGFTNCQAHLHFARETQGGAVTASRPVYFLGHTDKELVRGDIVSGEAPVCDIGLGESTAGAAGATGAASTSGKTTKPKADAVPAADLASCDVLAGEQPIEVELEAPSRFAPKEVTVEPGPTAPVTRFYREVDDRFDGPGSPVPNDIAPAELRG